MAGGRGLKREDGAKRGGEEKGATGKWTTAGKGAKRGGEEKGATGGGTTAGKGAKSGSDAAAASDVEDGVTFTRPPPPAAQVENYAVLNLDTPATSHDSWRATVLRFHLWCFTNTNNRYCFGHKERQSCMMPEAGHFLVYVHRHGKWMCLVIDGPTGYITGCMTRSSTKKKKIQENRIKIAQNLSKEIKKELKSKLPVHIEAAEMLPVEGDYVFAAECLLGDLGLQNSFTVLYKHLEGTQIYERNEVQEAWETIILHLPEACRSNVLYHKIDDGFLDVQNKLGQILLGDSRNWAVRTRKAFQRMIDSSPDKWALKKHGKSTAYLPKDVKEKEFGLDDEKVLLIIEDIRVYFREEKYSRVFRLKDLPVQLGSDGPVNNKLDKLLKLGAQDLEHSMFLIKPFMKFKRACSSNQTSTESKVNRNMDKKLGTCLVPQGRKNGLKSNVTKVEEKFKGSLDLNSCKVSALVMSEQHQQARVKHQQGQIMSQQVHQQAEETHSSAGLQNLGNTCFANSVLQFLHCIPDLKSALIRFSEGIGNKLVDEASCKLTDAICEIFVLLDSSLQTVCPKKFLKKLEDKHAIYKERDGNLHRQQDAGECLLHLMETLTETLKTEERESTNLIKRLFGVDLLSSVSSEGGETVDYLNCLMPKDVNGFLKGLELTLEYPLEFDAHSLCSDELKLELEGIRKATSTDGEDSLNMDTDQSE
ncbi:hypothetical protein ACQ4PT_019476 [Festuca glaucescens]